MKKFSYLILFLISTYISVAQTKPSLDSLYNIYKIARQDTTKILILGDITTVLLNNNIDSAMAVAQKMSMWSNKINYSKGKGLACQKLSIVYFTKGQYAQAKETALKGIEVLKYLREPRILAMLYNSLGMIYRIEGNYAHSIIYCEKSLLLSKLIKDKNEEASSYNNIGLVYYQQSNYVEALHYFHKSLELAEINKNIVLLARLNGNIGIIYSIQKNTF
jgi:tetratricopeptide (TPR) repeat protein